MCEKETEAEPIVSPVPKKRTDEKRHTADKTSEEDAKRDICGMASTCTSAMTDLNQELANPEHEPCKRISQEICDKPVILSAAPIVPNKRLRYIAMRYVMR